MIGFILKECYVHNIMRIFVWWRYMYNLYWCINHRDPTTANNEQQVVFLFLFGKRTRSLVLIYVFDFIIDIIYIWSFRKIELLAISNNNDCKKSKLLPLEYVPVNYMSKLWVKRHICLKYFWNGKFSFKRVQSDRVSLFIIKWIISIFKRGWNV